MELYERDFFISEIIYGIKLLEDGDSYIEIHPMTIRQKFIASKVFMDAYQEALLNDVKTRKEMVQLLIDEEIWSEEFEKELNEIDKKKEDAKVTIYENFLRPSTREKAREELRSLEARELKLLSIKNANNHLDCEGIATYTRSIWIIENTAKFEDGTKYDFSSKSVTQLMSKLSSSDLDMDDFRELARNDPWKTMWAIEKSAESIFQRKISELTDSQKLLATWARIYDSIQESPESPSDDVVEDNDAIDGWFIVQKRKREKEQGKQKLDGLDKKHGNADEVFVMARSDEERREIVNMNEAHGKGAIKNRLQKMQVKGSKGKGMEYHNFGDVNQRKMMQAAAMKNSKRR